MEGPTTDEVLQRNIPWEKWLTARCISDRDLQLIRRFDKSTETKQASLVEEVRALTSRPARPPLPPRTAPLARWRGSTVSLAWAGAAAQLLTLPWRWRCGQGAGSGAASGRSGPRTSRTAARAPRCPAHWQPLTPRSQRGLSVPRTRVARAAGYGLHWAAHEMGWEHGSSST